MKKSFILSLVMVVVLIASLATATYAWYTAQTTVNTNNVTVYTAGAGESLVISAQKFNADKTYANNQVTLAITRGLNAAAGLNPSVIKGGSTPTSGMSGTALGSFDIISTTTDAEGNAHAQSSASTATNLATVTSVTDVVDDDIDNDTGYIFVSNPGASPIVYTAKVTIANVDANNGLRVALFQYTSGTTAGNEDVLGTTDISGITDAAFKLVGIWAKNGESVNYADSFTAGSAPDDQTDPVNAALIHVADTESTVEAIATLNDSTIPAVSAGGVMYNNIFKVVAWYEGSKITSDYQNKTATFNVEFNKKTA